MHDSLITSRRLRSVMVLASLLAATSPIWGQEESPPDRPSDRPPAARARQAIERGLVFLEQDVVKWRAERQCATCHHGTLTLWVYLEATQRGYFVPPETVRETAQWTKDRLLERVDLPRDTRPGWSMVSTPAIYLALAASAVPTQDVLSADDLQRISGHLLRHQESHGAWEWSSAPAKNRPPPFFESDEVATRLASLALASVKPRDDASAVAVSLSRKKAATWLGEQKPSEMTQAAAVRLLMELRDEGTPERLTESINGLLEQQRADGGWGQLPGRDSDAYATGQVLYSLSLADVPRDTPAIQRGIEFLISTQRADGSWPMVPRAHPEATPANNTIPITYFGSAWGVMGLVRSVEAVRGE